MSDMMTFPETWEEYEKQYGFTDDEEIYTNGSRLIPSFRVKQWLDHLPSAEPKTPSNGSITCMKPKKMHDRTTGDLISREDACEAVKNEMESWLEGDRCDYRNVVDAIMDLPSAEKAQLSGEDATKDATSDLIRRQDAIEGEGDKWN